MFEKNNDGVELRGLGSCTLEQVFNDPNGIGNIEDDEEYYYVFLNHKPGYCGDSLWMVNKKTKMVSFTDVRDLVFNDVLDKLKPVTLEEFRRAVL